MTLEEKDPQQDRAERRVGSELCGKWRLVRLLGIGGMAAVYEAEHRNGSSVAIKILHQELVGVEEARERFTEEAYAANRVRHPGTCKVLDDGLTDEGAPFLVMELLVGDPLDELQLSPSHAAVDAVVRLARPLLEILAAAHESGIVHRDIKPENVFITRGGRVKLLDFGIARMINSQRTQRTQCGNTMGTPAYMPPEQARGRWDEVDHRSDLWALGATLFSVVTGRTVHEAETTNEILLASMTHPAPSVGSVAPSTPPELAEFIDRCLAFERAERFQSAEEALAQLEQVEAALGVVASAPAPPSSSWSDDDSPDHAPDKSTFRPVALSRPSQTLAGASERGGRAAHATHPETPPLDGTSTEEGPELAAFLSDQGARRRRRWVVAALSLASVFLAVFIFQVRGEEESVAAAPLVVVEESGETDLPVAEDESAAARGGEAVSQEAKDALQSAAKERKPAAAAEAGTDGARGVPGDDAAPALDSSQNTDPGASPGAKPADAAAATPSGSVAESNAAMPKSKKRAPAGQPSATSASSSETEFDPLSLRH